mmetsp:Transcript_5761/g.18198  ORF Transcript_5761/g.18198 Transcript_5761/m.18198 type:complete len:327 (+) Transcript_5761:4222-5202(+)
MTATYVDSTGVMPNCRISFTSGNTSSNEVHRRMASLHLVKLDAVMREDSSSSSESIRFSFKNVSNTASLSLLLSRCSIRGTSIISPFVVLSSLTEDVFNTSLVPSFSSNRVPPKLPPSSFSSSRSLLSSSSSMLPINTALTFLDFFTSLLLIFVSRATFAIFDDFGRLCLFCRSSRAAFLLFPAPLPLSSLLFLLPPPPPRPLELLDPPLTAPTNSATFVFSASSLSSSSSATFTPALKVSSETSKLCIANCTASNLSLLRTSSSSESSSSSNEDEAKTFPKKRRPRRPTGGSVSRCTSLSLFLFLSKSSSSVAEWDTHRRSVHQP